MMNIKTEEGDLIVGEICGNTYLICVRNEESYSSFVLTPSEMIDFIANMQKALVEILR